MTIHKSVIVNFISSVSKIKINSFINRNQAKYFKNGHFVYIAFEKNLLHLKSRYITFINSVLVDVQNCNCFKIHDLNCVFFERGPITL